MSVFESLMVVVIIPVTASAMPTSPAIFTVCFNWSTCFKSVGCPQPLLP